MKPSKAQTEFTYLKLSEAMEVFLTEHGKFPTLTQLQGLLFERYEIDVSVSAISRAMNKAVKLNYPKETGAIALTPIVLQNLFNMTKYNVKACELWFKIMGQFEGQITIEDDKPNSNILEVRVIDATRK